MRKKVLAITGIRSEYDILYPVINELRKNENFEVKVAVCGTHLSDWHNFTSNKIEEDGFEIAGKISYSLDGNFPARRTKAIGTLLHALSETTESEKPDFLLVVGDREESIATAIVGNYMDTLVAHIGGGDTVYGNADDPVRFAVSKLAHIHFAITEESAKNLRRIGEEEFRIFWSGNPAFDNIRRTKDIALGKVSEFLSEDITNGKYLVFIKHPLSSERQSAYSQMKLSLEVLEEFCAENDTKVIGIYPNTDPGSSDMLKAIEEFNGAKHVRFYKNLPRDIFVNLLKNALVLAGNSSMGILEAPFYKLPVVNIGNRQKGRFNAGNVEFVGYDKKDIKKVLRRACFDDAYRKHVRGLKNPGGDGTASEKILRTLLSIDLKEKKWYIKKNLW